MAELFLAFTSNIHTYLTFPKNSSNMQMISLELEIVEYIPQNANQFDLNTVDELQKLEKQTKIEKGNAT